MARVRLALLAGALLALAGCGGGRSVETVSQPPPATTAAPPPVETTSFRVYFLRGEQVAAAGREVPRTEAVGVAALRALIAGPTYAERAAGLGTTVPPGTELRSLAIAAGLATVDLSSDFESGGSAPSTATRVAQVVHTLTQFPTVRRVAFRLDGRPVRAIGGEGVVVDPPVSRASFEREAPAILVESPTPGEAVSSPLAISGTANTFEATFSVKLADGAGRTLAERVVTATSGSGTRGTFATSLAFPAGSYGPATLVAYERSAEDGRPIHTVEIPLELR